jgi:hypothetical protein
MIDHKKINKLFEIVDKKYLSKMFDEPIEYEVGEINVVYDKHIIIDIIIPSYYFNNEPYASKINKWWENLLKIQELYHHIFDEGSINFQPIKK